LPPPGWSGTVARSSARAATGSTPLTRRSDAADHFLDHLAEIEALLAGQPTEPDRWRASLVTVDSDWARFTEVDLNEASQRFTRLGQIYVQRYTAAGPDQWDTPRGENRTLREIAEHVASSWYAEQVGDLGASAMP
jgi:hypothetical protein